ncbi:MAG TPA: hypothetical protein VFX92_05705 [Candidatus Krumholzibacteria bacterium]|nr:hypothetical protein [Candidatus Krumholzibacteria bacterium]
MMRNIGLGLIVAGFLGAAWVATQRVDTVDWKLFVPLAAVGVVGVVVARRATRSAAAHADTVAANMSDLAGAIGRIVTNVGALNRDKASIHPYDMRHRIDALLLDDLAVFAEARETIAVRFGLQPYAEVMGHFAAGERYVNRVWSASADGYVDEINDYIARAEEQFVAVQDRLGALTA